MTHTKQDLAAYGHWFIIDAKNGVDQLVMRLRTDRPTDGDIDSYATAVVIKWEYQHQPGTAKPPDDVWRRWEAFEEAVADLAWETGCSYLMNISTGLGLREWCYYAKDRVDFMRRFNALLAGHERYPLEIEFYDDPEWKVWLDLRFAYERAGGPPAPPVRANPPMQRTGAAGIFSGVRKWFGRGPGH